MATPKEKKKKKASLLRNKMADSGGGVVLDHRIDHFGGVIVRSRGLPDDVDAFEDALDASLAQVWDAGRLAGK